MDGASLGTLRHWLLTKISACPGTEVNEAQGWAMGGFTVVPGCVDELEPREPGLFVS